MSAQARPPASAPPPGEYGRHVPVTPFRGYLLALAVLLGSVASVILFWRNAYEREMSAAQADFVSATQQMAALVQQRMINYELALGGGAALFASVRPTPQQWQSFVDGLDTRERFPGLLGMGFAPYVTPDGLRQLQIESHDAGYGLFRIRPPGVRANYGPILYLAPMTLENRGVIGYDMFSEPVRRTAMIAARDSGKPRLSGPVKLLQDDFAGSRQTGLLLYSPIFRLGDTPRSLDARRESLQGWVYIPFHMPALVQTALPYRDRYEGIQLQIYDDTGPKAELLYTDAEFGKSDEAAFSRSVQSEAYGRRWRMDFRSGPAEAISPGLAGLRTLLLVGLLSSLLLFWLAMLLARTENRARQIATQLTEDYRRSEQRFRMAMVYSAIGKALLDHEGRVVEANPALCDIVGRDPERLAGVPFSSLFDDATDPIRTTEMEAVAEGVYRTTRRLHRNDELRYVQLTYAPVPGNVGQDIARLVQVEDVSERLHAEAQVRALNRTLETRVAQRTRELSAANNELESFAYSISHDLRTPLRSIEGFSRLLAERYQQQLDGAGRDYLARIRNATSRMSELIEALLKMSRLSRSQLNPLPLDLSQLAAEVVAELRSAEPGREVEVAIAPGLQAVGDPALVRNLLMNLLGNAWKFTRDCDRPRIEFFRETRGVADEPVFVVRDNGAGFEADYVGKLFRPFQRLHSQEQFSGHGIGLASVRRIVERHGGTIQADGKPGEGATFKFTLPGEGA
ncbi:CHASE domain-containing protein [Luteimonas sp. SX5]|uniref:histidine kinase n=1 Tax=Luteimonas galliterrae TaxID=2940486 RepID=A0ABT0MGA6_9GAMM|nr:CHASE domain-containing protein [Luteimonas galliterrae]MCL1633698.1 CHASE domain-containing protein [Luteimonas galliterrae]